MEAKNCDFLERKKTTPSYAGQKPTKEETLANDASMKRVSSGTTGLVKKFELGAAASSEASPRPQAQADSYDASMGAKEKPSMTQQSSIKTNKTLPYINKNLRDNDDWILKALNNGDGAVGNDYKDRTSRKRPLKRHFCDIEGCKKHYSQKGSLKRHKAQDHSIDVVFHKCDFEGCDMQYKRKDSLKRHKAFVHNIGGVDLHECDFEGCDMQYKQKSSLKRHKAQDHSIDVVYHECDFEGCDMQYKRKDHLKRHKALVHNIGGVLHECDFEGCKKQYKTKDHLKRHKSIMHNFGNLECEKKAASSEAKKTWEGVKEIVKKAFEVVNINNISIQTASIAYKRDIMECRSLDNAAATADIYGINAIKTSMFNDVAPAKSKCHGFLADSEWGCHCRLVIEEENITYIVAEMFLIPGNARTNSKSSWTYKGECLKQIVALKRLAPTESGYNQMHDNEWNRINNRRKKVEEISIFKQEGQDIFKKYFNCGRIETVSSFRGANPAKDKTAYQQWKEYLEKSIGIDMEQNQRKMDEYLSSGQ
eukprot:g5988.t1